MTENQDFKEAARTIFNDAADSANAGVPSFWDRFARRTLDHLGLVEGDRVLDVCCGTGTASIPAAALVGATGEVVGIDIAESAIEIARTRATLERFMNAHFRVGDAENLELPDECFDKVACVFGLFFVPDMIKCVNEMYRVLKTGGKLAITTWADVPFEPAATIYWNALQAVDPTVVRTNGAPDRLNRPELLVALFNTVGIAGMEVTKEVAVHRIREPEDWWQIMMGTAFRVRIDRFDEAMRRRVHDAIMGELVQQRISELQVNTIYAFGTKAS